MHSRVSCSDFCCHTKKWLCHVSLRCHRCQQLKSTCTLSQIYPPHSLPVMSQLLWRDLFLFPLACLFPLSPFSPWQRPIIYICKIKFFLKPVRCFELAQSLCVFCWCFFFFDHLILRKFTCATQGMYNCHCCPYLLPLISPLQNNSLQLFDELQPNLWEEFYFKSRTDNNKKYPCWCPEEDMAKWKKHLTFHQKEDGASAWNFLISGKIMYQELVLLLFCLSWLSSVYVARANCTCSPGWCESSWTTPASYLDLLCMEFHILSRLLICESTMHIPHIHPNSAPSLSSLWK